jgi:hypothetical protein
MVDQEGHSGPNWVSTSEGLPADGQEVLAKSRFHSEIVRVTFRRHPAPRWEDANHLYSLAYFDEWARL